MSKLAWNKNGDRYKQCSEKDNDLLRRYIHELNGQVQKGQKAEQNCEVENRNRERQTERGWMEQNLQERNITTKGFTTEHMG